MPRPFVGEVGLAAGAERAEFVHLLELEVKDAVVRVNTGAQDLVTEPYAIRIGADTGRYMIRNPVVAPWVTTALTIEAWARLDADADTQIFNALLTYAAAIPGDIDEIQVGVDSVSGLFRMRLGIDSTFVSEATTAPYPSDENYHHLVWTWLSAGGVWFMYRDGVQVATGTGLKTGYSITGGGALVLGQEQDALGGSFAANEAWKGELDDVRVYRRVLSAAEVLAHFQRRFPNEQLLIGHWSFDVFGGNPAQLGLDASPVGNHLTVTGITLPVEGAPFVKRTWEAIGGVLEFGGIEETGDVRGQGVDVRFSGVDQSILTLLLASKFRGRGVKIWRAHLDSSTGKIIPDPILLFQGLQLNPYQVTEERTRQGGAVRIATRLTGMLGLQQVRGIQANLPSHQHYFPGDVFFQHVASLVNTKIYWGTRVPQTPGRRGGSDREGTQPYPPDRNS